MPTITIDGKRCEFEGRKTILQVALDNDIEIPHYCYHPGLSIVASCRICLAEVAQPNPRNDNKVELIPKLLPTCQTPAVDGAEVYLESEKSKANQAAVMEYLLINHPLDCPVCDQAGECFLQDYSYRYGRAYSRFQEDKIKNPKKDVGPHILLYSDRCIMCSRCVRFTREVTDTGELCVTQRGARAEIDVFPGKALDNELSGNVADICPVGALLDKDFLFEQRVWYLRSAASIDGITCSGDNIRIDHNEGRAWRIKPRVNMDVNTWWISDEIRYGWKFIHDDNRLTSPLLQQDGEQVARSWREAYQQVLEGFEGVTAGGKRLGAIISPMLSCEDAYLLAKAVRAMDDKAILAMGPVPVHGQDKTFPSGYTVYAEKAPNARGVRRVLEMFAGSGQPIEYDAMVNQLKQGDAEIGGMLVTGNYPSPWVTDQLVTALGETFTVLIDTLPNRLTDAADVVLPGSTWAEKAGTFENVHHRLQSFEQAITPIEFTKPEGQIALDMLKQLGKVEQGWFDPAAVREEIGGALASEVHHPDKKETRTSEMAFAEI